MKRHTPIATTAVLTAALLLQAPVTALAQDEAPEKRRGSAAALMEEIQVTARKRSEAENAQSVPIAISAFGADQLDAMFVKKIDDMSYSAPNVHLEDVGTFPGVQNFSIRGQGINSSIPSVDATVGTFIDGVYMGITYGVVIDMFDVESIEVLRGPQGLLFGRNVTGGAVNIRTALPDGEFSGKMKVNVTDSDQYTVAGSVSFPVTETLSGKVVAYYDDDQGYFHNAYDGTPIGVGFPIYFNPAQPNSSHGAMKTKFLRTSWVLDATENLELIARLEAGNADGDGAAWTSVGAQRDGGGNAFYPGELPEFTTTMDETGYTDIEWQQANLEARWTVGNGTVTNILAYRDMSYKGVVDVDGSAAQLFSVEGSTDQDQISNELRYAATVLDGKLDYVAGLYYFQQDIDYKEARWNLVRAIGGSMDHTSIGIFTNLDYHVSDRLTLTAGVRYTDEEKDSVVIDSREGACPDLVTFVCPMLSLPGKWDSVTPKLGFDYALSDDAIVYGHWSKGFRSGGVNFRNAKANLIPAGPTRQEEQNSYEIGLKSDLVDGRLRLNVAYFYNTVDDMQRELNTADADVVVLQGTVNAGDASIQGVEMDFVALLGDNFSINGYFGYLDGSWDHINPTYDPAVLEVLAAGGDAAAAAALANGLYIGKDLPRLSPVTAGIGATYDVDMGQAGLLTFRANYAFRDRNADLDNNWEYFDAQRQVTASIDYQTADGGWRASLYGKNLRDEARWGNLAASSIGPLGPMQKGRVLGLEVQYTF